MRKAIVVTGAALALALSGGVSYADDTPDCPDIGHQVKVGPADPYDLDRDGDGIGCESYPGPATPLDIDDPSPVVSESPKPSLAETGWGPDEHPVRWLFVGGGLVAAGGVAVTVARRKGGQR